MDKVTNRSRWWTLAAVFGVYAVWANTVGTEAVDTHPVWAAVNTVFALVLLGLLIWAISGVIRVRRERKRRAQAARVRRSIALREHSLGVVGHSGEVPWCAACLLVMDEHC